MDWMNTAVGSDHEHERVFVGWDGVHRHMRCLLCGELLCASSRSIREEIQTREVTDSVVAVKSGLRGSRPVVGLGIQQRTLMITTARCGHKTVTTVDATPWV